MTTMELHTFFQKYANTPLDKRDIPIGHTRPFFSQARITTLNDVYTELKKIQEQKRPYILKEENLLKLAEIMFKYNK